MRDLAATSALAPTPALASVHAQVAAVVDPEVRP